MGGGKSIPAQPETTTQSVHQPQQPATTSSTRSTNRLPLSLTTNRMPLSRRLLLQYRGAHKSTQVVQCNRPSLKCSRVAIILAVDDYSSTQLQSLRYAVSDAARVKTAVETMGFQVLTFATNADCNMNSMNASFDQLYTLFKSRTLAQLIFYYAGHGVVSDGQEKGWFALSGWNKDKPNLTGVRFSKLKQFAASIGACQQLYILDSCHSGRTIFESTRGPSDDPSPLTSLDALQWAQRMLQQPAIWAITAVTGHEASIEVSESVECGRNGSGGGGLFTDVLIQGFKNPNLTTASELLLFLQQKVAKESNGSMTPQGGRILLSHYSIDATGEFVFPCALQLKPTEKVAVPTTPTMTMFRRRTPALVQSDPKSRRRSNVRMTHRHTDPNVHVLFDNTSGSVEKNENEKEVAEDLHV